MNNDLERTLARLVEQADSPPTKRPTVRMGEKTVRAFDVSTIRSINEDTRTIVFTASTAAIDRYGDSIDPRGWQLENFQRNPVFLFGHKSNELPIGKVLKCWTEPKALMATVQFADRETYPFAETVFQLYRQGYMRAVSVGFMPLENPKPIFDEQGCMTGYEFTKQELLELSAVPVPANPEALARAIDDGVLTSEFAKRFAKQTDEEEPGEEPEEPGESPLEELAEEVSESLDEIQAALTEAVGNLAVLVAAIQSGGTAKGCKPKKQPKPNAKNEVDELLSAIVNN